MIYNFKMVKDLLAQSTRATCGITEREVIVPRNKLNPSIKQLQSKGFYVVGTSHAKTPLKKIWFVRGGGL